MLFLSLFVTVFSLLWSLFLAVIFRAAVPKDEDFCGIRRSFPLFFCGITAITANRGAKWSLTPPSPRILRRTSGMKVQDGALA
jgi:hypothetical protein